ncbi:MAG: anti-sigma factor [Tepidiformaceae bacterium]
MVSGHLTQEEADEYAIGSLESDEERAIALHLADCPSCHLFVREAERVATRFAIGITTRPPSPKLKRRIFRVAGITRTNPLRRASVVVRAVAGVAAVIVAIAAFTGMVSVRNQVHDLHKANQELQTQIDDALSQKVEIAAITRRLSDEEIQSFQQSQAARGDRDLLLAMLSPKSDVADVYSPDDQTAAIGRLVWNDEQKRIWFVADNLPQRPADQTYQLWVNAGGKYTSLGTFKPDDSGFARYVTIVPQGMSSYDTAVVTIEQSGGASQRSGPFVFSADLSSIKH